MSRRQDEDLMASVVVVGATLAIALALMGALFLPSGVISKVFVGKWPFRVTLALALVGVPLMLRFTQRKRIREAVESGGGTLLKMERLPFWRQADFPQSYQRPIYGYPWWRGVLYKVDFTDLLGASHHSICHSGFFRGVQWLEDVPD